MTARVLVRVWIASLLLVLAAASATVARGWNRPSIELPPGNVSVAIIGSSLLRNAVPFSSPEEGVVGDGRPHLRVGVSSITQAEEIYSLDQVVKRHADLVFLEANPFVVSFTGRGGSPGKRWSFETWWTDTVGVPFRRGIDRFRGRGLTANLAIERLRGTFKPQPSKLRKLYPISLGGLSNPESLGQVLEQARLVGTRVILIVPPRPRSVAKFMGPANLDEIETAYEALAVKYGLELWVFGTDWPDGLFADHAHLNREGRERFVAELRRRYQGTP